MPAGASVRQIIHYGQLMESDHFQKYDYGSVTNLMKYSSLEPPIYPLKKITTPIALHYGLNDWFTHIDDIQKLINILPNVIGTFEIKDSHFNHFDFVLAYNVRDLVYQNVLNIMEKYE